MFIIINIIKLKIKNHLKESDHNINTVYLQFIYENKKNHIKNTNMVLLLNLVFQKITCCFPEHRRFIMHLAVSVLYSNDIMAVRLQDYLMPKLKIPSRIDYIFKKSHQ